MMTQSNLWLVHTIDIAIADDETPLAWRQIFRSASEVRRAEWIQ